MVSSVTASGSTGYWMHMPEAGSFKMPISSRLSGDPVKLQILEEHLDWGLSFCISRASVSGADVGPLKSTFQKASMLIKSLKQVAREVGSQTRFVWLCIVCNFFSQVLLSMLKTMESLSIYLG